MPDLPDTSLAPVSRDALLGGRVILLQPQNGYRAAIDPVLLAATVPAKGGEMVLDAGSGTGAASLALAVRVQGVQVTGLENQAGLATLASQSAQENGLDERVTFIQGDILSPPSSLLPGSFDHVMANPPYLAQGQGNPPPDAAKRAATVEGNAVLADWLRFMLAMVGDGGSVSVIHRYKRLDEVVNGLTGAGAGQIVVFPLWAKERGKNAKRVLVQACKGKTGATRHADGLVLHMQDGGYRAAAEAVLKDAAPITL